MIGLEQWRAAVGAWHAGSTRAYRRYVNGRQRIVCNWQKLLFHTASIHYSVTWFIAVLFAFVSGSVASALGFNVDCRYSQSLCTAVKSPGKVCHDSAVRSCAADLCRLLKLATPSLVSMLRLLSALRWLLIVAGDVELNPGPVSQELEKLLETTDASVLMEDDLFSVYREVLDLALNWMDVGLVLGLRHIHLKEIHTTNRESPRKCLMEALKLWLKQEYDIDRNGLPTWKKMVEVTADPIAGENPALAATLARNHQGTTHTARSNPPRGIEQDEIDSEEDRKLLEAAMKEGYINARFLKVIFTGAGGVGKTHTICLLRGVLPPIKRTSTDCVDKAVTLRVDASNDEKWEEIDQEKRLKVIAEAICAANSPQQSLEEIPQPQPEVGPNPPPETQQEQQSPQSHQSTTSPVLSQSLEELLKSIHELTTSGAVSEKVLEIKWVYVVDTGGQPPFHELLSAFIKGASVCAFVFKLSKSLDHRPEVNYWPDGKKVDTPFEHPLSNRQILEQSIQTIEALPSLSDEHSKSPLLLVIGTHRDEQDKCTDETLEDKEGKLCDIMEQSGCKVGYNKHSGVERVIFDVNAKDPEQRDKDIAAALRREIAKGIPKPKKIPLRYYGLELVLEHLSTKQGVISMTQCDELVGDILSFDEKGLKAALRFLHNVNVLLYYPEVKEVEELIFCDPLFLMKVVSKMVKHTYEGATSEWKDSRERGLITIGQLDTVDFHEHFPSGIFTPESLFKLFEHLLIVAKVRRNDREFFMPCLLDDATLDETTRIRSKYCNPLTFQFRKKGKPVFAPSGLFSALVAFLCSSWTVIPDAESGGNVYRNIIAFHSRSLSADITLINFPTSFEAFAICQPNFLREIRAILLKGIEEARMVRNFELVDYNEAFTCKCPKANDEPHLAEIHIEENSWYCPLDPMTTGHLEISELAWFKEVPQILQHPSSLENVTLGSDVEFVVEATGSDLSYTWHHLIPECNSKKELSEKNKTLHVKEVKSDAEGDYVCTISNPTGVTVKTKPARLTTMQIPWIKKQPSSEEDVTPGENVRFAVEAIGMKLSFSWHHHTSKQPLPSEKKLVGEEQTLHIKKVKSDDEGYYTCTISNPAGHVETVPVRLTTIPQITDKPHDVKNAAPGKPAELVVKAIGKDLTYTWHHQTAKDASKVEVGENNPTLRIDKVKSDDEGYYTCTISNPTGGTVETTPARLTTTPEIIKKPSSQENVTLGRNVDFVVEATGMNLSYTWHHQTSKDASKVEVGEDNPTLHIDKVKSDDEGYYTCTISNLTGGTVESHPAQLTTKPKIINPPKSKENTIRGSYLEFVVKATGKNLSYTWHHLATKDSLPSEENVVGCDKILCIDGADSDDEGYYICIISNQTRGTVETEPAQLKITCWSKYRHPLIIVVSAVAFLVIAVLVAVPVIAVLVAMVTAGGLGPSEGLQWQNNTALSSQTPEVTPGLGSQAPTPGGSIRQQEDDTQERCTKIGGYLEASHAIESDFSKWRLLGEELGITPTELNRIDREQDGELSKLRETIQEWWRGVPADKFCWEKLIAALQTLKKINLAERISKQYIE